MRIGDTVRLKKGLTKETATIKSKYNNVRGALIIDPPLDGFRSWNEEDLELVIKNKEGIKI